MMTSEEYNQAAFILKMEAMRINQFRNYRIIMDNTSLVQLNVIVSNYAKKLRINFWQALEKLTSKGRRELASQKQSPLTISYSK